ncbi:ADP-ribosylglycohydrolase family protein [Arthrobacter echini]|uniref:ADP-ribosylglycohydrolase family protein n=1 Tax=Arthrobacter echini TaxID=1529066 RepID=A0A4S5E430_9MICC|nr:ADP-ribosylglycohydrolase family protein [Arthrobacter echini]THJ66231.1 ADP-ribosylglycohydrolase family protein [Arthrobacter echini]
MTNHSRADSTATTDQGAAEPAPTSYEDRVLGCLLGIMAGDAYGLLHTTGGDPRAAFVDPAPLAVSDATSLTLYSTDGLIEALEWANDGVAADETACLWLAYLRWLDHQGEHPPASAPAPPPRWLDLQPDLPPAEHPDQDTVRALLSGEMGTRARPLNAGSTGPGALMRSAPFGLVPRIPATMVERLTLDAAALTHGGTGATEPAAAYSGIIRSLVIEGGSLTAALGDRAPDGPGPTRDAAAPAGPAAAPTAAGTLAAALQAVREGTAATDSPDEQMATALARAVAPGAADASPVIAASLTGGVLGALHGTAALPSAYLSSPGTPEVVRTMARKLLAATTGT